MPKKILYDDTTELGRYRVIEQLHGDRPARLLIAGSEAPQSGVALDDEPELLFHYIQRCFEIALSLQPKKVLMIGGGAFTLPRTILERLPVRRVDVVEINPTLPGLAQKFFGLPDDSRLHIHIEDGADYIASTRRHYHLIIVDAFDVYDIPAQLLTTQAAKHYARRLSRGGVFVINFIARYHATRPTFTHQLISTFGTAFTHVDVYPCDVHEGKRDEQNLLLVASNSPLELDYLQSSPTVVQPALSRH